MVGRAIYQFAEGAYNQVSQKVPAGAAAISQSIAGAVERAKEVDWKEVPGQAVEVAKNNPQAVIIPVAALTAPVLMGPVLGAAGFSAIGPVSGSLAANLMSSGAVGPVYSMFQSAAMGGYGVAGATAIFSSAGAVVGGLGSTVYTATRNQSVVEPADENENDDETVASDAARSPEAKL